MARHPVFDVLKHFLHPGPSKHPLSARDQKLLEGFREAVERHQSDPEFTTALAAACVGMSRMHLNRKLRALTGRSTHEYIRERRLEEARALLSQPLSVASIARSVWIQERFPFRPGVPGAVRGRALGLPGKAISGTAAHAPEEAAEGVIVSHTRSSIHFSKG